MCVFVLYVAKWSLGLVKIEPLLVSGDCRSCGPVLDTGFCRASDDTYSLWKVVQFFRTPNLAFVRQFAPPTILSLCWSW